MSGVAWNPVVERLTRAKKAAVTQSSQLPLGLATWEYSVKHGRNQGAPDLELLQPAVDLCAGLQDSHTIEV